MGTMIVGGILVIVVALIVTKMVKNKKAGTSGCGCGCGGCSAQNSCHPKKDA